MLYAPLGAGMGSTEMRDGADGRKTYKYLHKLWLVPAALAAAGTLVLWFEAINLFRSVPESMFLWWERWAALVVLAVTSAWLLAYLSYWLVPVRRRKALQSSTAQLPTALVGLVAGLSGLGLLLGGSVYLNCTDYGLPLLSPATWTLGLFVGITDAELIGRSGVCMTTPPAAFHLARFAALAATFAGVLGVIVALYRDQIARYRVRMSSDIDVVTGVSELSLPLVEALIRERQARIDSEPWFNLRWTERLRKRRLTKVVVIHPQRDDPIVSEIAVLGGIVIVGEPTDNNLLTEVLTHKTTPWLLGRRRVMSVRRLFAVDSDQNLNLEVHAAAEAALQRAELPDFPGVSGSEPVSRIVVRLDNPIEARDWRTAMVGRERWFVDGLATDDLIADGIMRQLEGSAIEHLIIIGDTALSMTLLHYWNWRAWLHQELLRNEQELLVTSRWTVPRITLAGRRSELVLREWRKNSGRHRSLLNVDLASGDFNDWEQVCHERFRSDSNSAAVVTLEGPEELARATRLARLHKSAKVMCRDNNVEGVDAPFLGHKLSGFLIRFGPTLLHGILRTGSVNPQQHEHVSPGRLSGKSAPEDMWTQVARILHLRWTSPSQNGENESIQLAARRPWGRPGDPEKLRLPEFFREDTLRQIRQCLRGVQQLGGRSWASTDREESRCLSPVEIVWLARNEHERWCRYRVAAGWGSFVGFPTDTDSFTPHELKILEYDQGLPRTDTVNIETTIKNIWMMRFERARVNPNLRTWTGERLLGREVKDFPGATVPADEQFDLARLRLANISTIQFLLEALERWGIVPVRDAEDEMCQSDAATPRSYKRVGFVRAEILNEPLRWPTDTGDSLHAARGDWWVEELVDETDPHSPIKPGSGRSIKPKSFSQTYKVYMGDRYERQGQVVAYRVLSDEEKVETQEGTATAEIGDWVVMDEDGDSWPVPDAVFRDGYKSRG